MIKKTILGRILLIWILEYNERIRNDQALW